MLWVFLIEFIQIYTCPSLPMQWLPSGESQTGIEEGEEEEEEAASASIDWGHTGEKLGHTSRNMELRVSSSQRQAVVYVKQGADSQDAAWYVYI